MMKATLITYLIVDCSALVIPPPVTRDAPTIPPPPKDKNGITFSLKANDQEISNIKRNKEELERVVQEHSTGEMKDVGPIDNYLDLWYVNMKNSRDRRKCMDKQISDMNLKAHIFPGIHFFQCLNPGQESPNLVQCLSDNGYGDCVRKGINPQGIATHGSKAGNDLIQAYHVVSNACSHKRALAQMLKKHKEYNSTTKYGVLMEDDVAFNRHDFLRKVVNFAEMYDGKYSQNWTMVQIDPFGSKCDRHIVGYFEGLPVWKPTNVNLNHECSNYWGAQALLVKYDSIPTIINHMETHPTLPLDWLPAELENGLAWHANIAKNPEMMDQYYAGDVHHEYVKFPDYCRKTVKASTIGAARN